LHSECGFAIDIDSIKTEVAPNMIDVPVRIEAENLPVRRKMLRQLPDVSQSESRIDKKRSLGTDYEIAPDIAAPRHDGRAEERIGIGPHLIALDERVDVWIVFLEIGMLSQHFHEGPSGGLFMLRLEIMHRNAACNRPGIEIHHEATPCTT
jgi:hypothetical protein